MRRTERSIEGFLDMGIAFYGMPWAFASWRQCGQFVFQILLGMRGVVVQLYERDQWRRHDEGLAADQRITSPVEAHGVAAIDGKPLRPSGFATSVVRRGSTLRSQVVARQQQQRQVDV